MKAFVVHKHAHPSNIPLTTDWPVPPLNDGEIMVDVYSAGLNFFDILQAQGKHQSKPPLPFTLGSFYLSCSEFAGKISHGFPLPANCPFKPGDRVFGAALGSYAEKVAVKLDSVMPLPDSLTFDQGAGLFVTWPTSYEALVGRAKLQPGEWVLVTAAAGGVGLAATQLAKGLGGKVIAAAGSQEKLDIAKKIWRGRFHFLSITNGKGVDVIYDPVVRSQLELYSFHCLKCIAWKGRAIVVGFAAGTVEKVPMNLVLLKNISIVGIHWGAYHQREPEHMPTVYRSFLDLLESGRVTSPVVYREVFKLDKLVDGLSALENRKTWGKAVARVKDEERVVKARL
ncbi:alcohol dehydrogenase [Mycena filopes]|nr:alcohol dehydrogenase [Mycena filopes]